MIASISARRGDQKNGRLQQVAPNELASIVPPYEDGVLWIDVLDPNEQDVGVLGERFKLHPLALQDLCHAHQRPKLDEYDGALFGVIYAVDPTSMHASELRFFWGRGFLISAHTGPNSLIDQVVARVRGEPEGAIGIDSRPITVADVVYLLLDEIVDAYFPVIDALVERTEDVEDDMFSDQRSTATLETLFKVKKELFHLRKVIAPSRDVINVLLRRDQTLFGNEFYPYFQDLYDRINRVVDGLDTYRDVLSTLLDSYLSLVSNDVNQTVKRMTAVTAILMVDALVAGIYGMNFAYMPELGWVLGYPFALGLMALFTTILLVIFRRIRWF